MIYLSRLMLNPLSRRVLKEVSQPYQMHRTLCHAFPNLSDEAWKNARVLFRVDESFDDEVKLSLIVQSKIKPNWDNFQTKVEDPYLLQPPESREWELRFAKGQELRFRLQANPTYSPIIAGETRKKGRFKSKRKGLYREAERLDWLRRQSERPGQESLGFELEFERDESGTIVPTVLKGRAIERNGITERESFLYRGQPYRELALNLPVCEVTDLNGGRVESERDLSHFDRARRPTDQPMPLQSQPAQNGAPRVVRFGSSEFSAARFEGELTVTDADAFALAVENGIGPAKGFGFGLLSVAPVAK